MAECFVVLEMRVNPVEALSGALGDLFFRDKGATFFVFRISIVNGAVHYALDVEKIKSGVANHQDSRKGR